MNIFSKLGFSVEVREEPSGLVVEGVRTHSLFKDLNNVWNTSTIESRMYRKISSIGFTIPYFFVPDFIYIIQTLTKLERPLFTSKRTLNRLLEALEATDTGKKILKKDNFNLLGSKSTVEQEFSTRIKLDGWQDNYLEVYSDRKQRYKLQGHLLYADPGTGKTIGSLALMTFLKMDHIIVVSPKTALENVWLNTLSYLYKQTPKVWSSISDTPLNPHYKLIVVHYEYLEKLEEALKKHKFHFKGKRVGIIVDECHNFNDITSKRTQALVRISREYASDTLFMSGTPLKAMGKELIPLISCIDHNVDQNTLSDFQKLFGTSKGRCIDILAARMGFISHRVVKDENTMGDVKLYHYRADVKLPSGSEYTLNSIKKKMVAYVEERAKYYKENREKYVNEYLFAIDHFRNTYKNNPTYLKELNKYQADVKNLPKSRGNSILFNELASACNKFEKEKIATILDGEVKRKFLKAKSVYKYPELTILGECLGIVLGKSRTNCIMEVATHLHEMKFVPIDGGPELPTMSLRELIDYVDKKTLIFTSFVDVLTTISSQLTGEGYTTATVYGETNNNLNEIIKAFHDYDNINPLIATFKSLSTAVPVTAANLVIMLDNPFRDIDYKQAVSRAYRKGQDKDVYVVSVFLDTGSEANISTRSKEIADEATATVAKIMGLETFDLNTSLESCSSCGGSPTSMSVTHLPVSQSTGTSWDKGYMNPFHKHSVIGKGQYPMMTQSSSEIDIKGNRTYDMDEFERRDLKDYKTYYLNEHDEAYRNIMEVVGEYLDDEDVVLDKNLDGQGNRTVFYTKKDNPIF